MVNVMKSSYLLGLIPDNWLEVRVIFIPKDGKDDYTSPRAWRPISLMNFVMKIMEKLLLWEHEDTAMRIKSLNDAQFGFRKMRSTESAHSVVAGHVEHALIQRNYTVMAALDIEGAYDNLQNSDMSNSLREFGASEKYIHRYEDFFNFRKNFIAHRGINLVNYPSQGAPQGG